MTLDEEWKQGSQPLRWAQGPLPLGVHMLVFSLPMLSRADQ